MKSCIYMKITNKSNYITNPLYRVVDIASSNQTCFNSIFTDLDNFMYFSSNYMNYADLNNFYTKVEGNLGM